MIIIRYKEENPIEFYHSKESCQRDYGESVDVREVSDNHPDVEAIKQRQQQERQQRETKRQQIRALIQKFEAGTGTPFEVQTALAHVIKHLI